MKKSWILIILSGLLIFTLAACTTAKAPPTSKEQPPQETEVPEMADTDHDDDGDDQTDDADTSHDDADADQEDEEEVVIDAAALFSANCARCHGANREGGGGPPLLPERLTKDPSAYVTTINNGSGPMPSFSGKLSADEIDALVEFILSEVE